jgi:dihydrofolate synthase/folylpolyglutamate synthase
MRYAGPCWQFDLPLPSLPGAHQIGNAGIALACLEQLCGLDIGREAFAQGLQHIEWPARLQRLGCGPLVKMLPRGWELWLDGGHNPGAGEVLAAALSGWADRPLYLVVGMLNTKDAAGFLAPLAPHARALLAVTIPGEDNPLPAAAIVAAAHSVGLSAEEQPSAAAALVALTADPTPARILICGSLHFAGTVLADNG